MQSLAKLVSDIEAYTKARNSWAHAPCNPGLGVDNWPSSLDGQAHADGRVLTSLPAVPKVPTKPCKGDQYWRLAVPMDQNGIYFEPVAADSLDTHTTTPCPKR
jgi:hypothetical protein